MTESDGDYRLILCLLLGYVDSNTLGSSECVLGLGSTQHPRCLTRLHLRLVIVLFALAVGHNLHRDPHLSAWTCVRKQQARDTECSIAIVGNRCTVENDMLAALSTLPRSTELALLVWMVC